MFWFRLTLLTVALTAITSGCDAYKPVPRISPRSSATSADANTLARGGSFTSVLLVSPRLKPKDGGYEAVAKLGGLKTAKIPLVSGEDGMSFEAIGLPVKASDVLVVEIYEGDTLKFIAKRADTRLDTNRGPPVLIKDCQLLSAPWDGLKSEGGCNWDIEEAK